MTSKYDRLGEHLATFDGSEITLSFAAVEVIVGPLPVEARRQASWWGTTGSGRYYHAHAADWRNAGYVAERTDFEAGTVTFRQVAPLVSTE